MIEKSCAFLLERVSQCRSVISDFGKSELPKTAQAEALGRPDGLDTRWQG